MSVSPLVKNQGTKTTTSSSAGQVRAVTVPAGVSKIAYTCEAAFYVDYEAVADEGAETQASQFMIAGPSTSDIPIWVLLGQTPPAKGSILPHTEEETTFYIIGSSTSQVIHFYPVIGL